MICLPCRQEADGMTPPIIKHRRCTYCDKLCDVNKGGKLRKHNANGVTCKGSTLYVVWGHMACDGCECMHRPKGSYRG